MYLKVFNSRIYILMQTAYFCFSFLYILWRKTHLILISELVLLSNTMSLIPMNAFYMPSSCLGHVTILEKSKKPTVRKNSSAEGKHSESPMHENLSWVKHKQAYFLQQPLPLLLQHVSDVIPLCRILRVTLLFFLEVSNDLPWTKGGSTGPWPTLMH